MSKGACRLMWERNAVYASSLFPLDNAAFISMITSLSDDGIPPSSSSLVWVSFWSQTSPALPLCIAATIVDFGGTWYGITRIVDWGGVPFSWRSASEFGGYERISKACEVEAATNCSCSLVAFLRQVFGRGIVSHASKTLYCRSHIMMINSVWLAAEIPVRRTWVVFSDNSARDKGPCFDLRNASRRKQRDWGWVVIV